MLFDDTYYTIAAPAESLFKDRGSKFLAFAFPVSSEAAIKEKLGQLKQAHPKANHHCYAYRLRPDKLNFRANDDGEPSGTAGKPILGQIQSHDLTDVLIVVVRYFGGTLLGAGGLINAYRSAAAEAIGQTTIIEKHILFQYKATFRFEHTSEVMKILKQHDCQIIEQGYDEQGFIILNVRKNRSADLESAAAAHGSPFLSLRFMLIS